jgi:hypothetical protein
VIVAGVDVDRYASLPAELVPWKPLTRWAQARDAALAVPPTHELWRRLEDPERWRMQLHGVESEARQLYRAHVTPLIDAGPLLFRWCDGDGPGHVSPFHEPRDFDALRRLAWAPFLRTWWRNPGTGPYRNALDHLEGVVASSLIALEIPNRAVAVDAVVAAFDDLAHDLAVWLPPSASRYLRALDAVS